MELSLSMKNLVDEDFEERVQTHTNIIFLAVDIVTSSLQKYCKGWQIVIISNDFLLLQSISCIFFSRENI